MSLRIGSVSYLNCRPLVEGLDSLAGVHLTHAVPAELPDRLDRGQLDVAMVPIIDVIRSSGRWGVVSDACIGCDGETMTVRLFSQTPPHRIRTIAADVHSHTSIALARVLWRELYDCTLRVVPFDAPASAPAAVPPECDAVLLIGDKVVNPRRPGYAYEIDLGGAWKAHTGLPFVFAVWAFVRRPHASREPAGEAPLLEPQWNDAARLLSSARDRGVAAAQEIAHRDGPRHGWPIELAVRYLVQCLKYRLDPRMVAGANYFAQLASREGLAPGDACIGWPRPSGELVGT